MLQINDYVTWGRPEDNNFGKILAISGGKARIIYWPHFDEMEVSIYKLRLAE